MTGEKQQWIRGEVEPCVLCEQEVRVGTDGFGVGHPMGETYQHTVCPNEALQQRVRALSERLYLSESVCWALYRIEKVGEASVDPVADADHLRRRWLAWQAALLGRRDA